MSAIHRLWTAGLLALLSVSSFAQKGWARYSVTVRNPAEVRRLSDSPLELFSEQVAIPKTDVIVGPGELPVLWSLDLSHQFVSPLPDPRAWYLSNEDGNDYRTSYLRYIDIIAQYDAWAAQYPSYVTKQTIGLSIQGRPIYAYKINGASRAAGRRNIVIAGNVHAREWIAASVPMHITERLCSSFTNNPQVANILRSVTVHVIPSLNPDGYEYSWTNNRMWRKNRRANTGGSFGVDLNRNYSVGWGGEGSSSNPSSDTYRGTAAFSEPELQALRNYVLTFPVIGFIDWHSYGEIISYPWSYTTNPAPGASWHQTVGDDMRAAMTAAGGHNYSCGQGSVIMYVAGGTSKDWFYTQYGATSYTVEVRDTGQNGFLLPESQITPTQDECWVGFTRFLVRLHQGS